MSASILPPIEEPVSFSSVQAPDEVNSSAHYPVIESPEEAEKLKRDYANGLFKFHKVSLANDKARRGSQDSTTSTSSDETPDPLQMNKDQAKEI